MIDLTNLLRATALSGLLAVTGSGAAFALPTSVTYTSFFPGTPLSTSQQQTDWNDGSQIITVPTFDTTLGTLDFVTLTLLGDVSSTGSLKNTGSSSTIFSYKAVTQIMLLPVGYAGGFADASGPLGAALAIASPTLINLTQRQTLAGGGSIAFNVTDAQATDQFASSSNLDAYETSGAGSLLFPLFTTTLTGSQTSGGNLSLVQTTTAFAELTVTYDFTAAPVPEPASMAMLGAGLAALGVVRRRRPAETDQA